MQIAVSIPLEVVQVNLDEVMVALYRGGWTESEPGIASSILDLRSDGWVSVAQEILRSRG